MTDSFDLDSPEGGVPSADDVRGFLSTYRFPLIVLGGLALTALVLGGVARRRGVPLARTDGYQPGSLERDIQRSADWEASLRHFAAAVDTRMQGFQQQLDALHAALGTEGPALHPSATAPHTNGAANISYESAVADQPENIPPAPAATSLP